MVRGAGRPSVPVRARPVPGARTDAALARAALFAWSRGLARCRARYEADGKWYSAIDLRKLQNSGKKAGLALSWWPVNSKWAYRESLRDLGRALNDFIKSRKGKRQGKRLG